MPCTSQKVSLSVIMSDVLAFAEIVQGYIQSLEELKETKFDSNSELFSEVSQELVRSKELLLQLQERENILKLRESGPDSESPPLPEINGDIVETLSCFITDDNITNVSLVGEVAINGTKWDQRTSDLYMKFNNVSSVKINDTFLEPVDVVQNIYKLKREHEWDNVVTGLVKYAVTNLPQVQCPILVTPVWQFKEAEIISMINLRPLIPVNYTLLKVCIKIGTKAQDILSKPTGFYNQVDGTIQWDLPMLEQDQILILRYKGGQRTDVVTSQAIGPPHVRIDFTASQLLTQVNVEYGYSPTRLTDLPLNVMTISGNYKAQ